MKEMCCHILYCDKVGRVDAMMQAIGLLERWLLGSETDPELAYGLVEFACSRGMKPLKEICRHIPRFRWMVVAHDRMGWCWFMEGMICTQVVEVQHSYQMLCGMNRTLKSWATGLVIKLMEITHGQWLYCNVLVHDSMSGSLVTMRKEEIQHEIEKQQLLGQQDLQEKDICLVEVNLEDLEDSSGERQEYWLILIQAARKAGQLAQKSANEESKDSGEVVVGNEEGH